LLRAGYIVLTGGVTGDVLTLTPPLNIDETLIEPFTQVLAASL
jgi:4-aminobutyrate aminotransferase-like enzyme